MATAVLSSTIMGLLLTPLAYIGMGALGGFAAAFAVISLPLLLASGLFLFYRYLRRPAGSTQPPAWLLAAEAIAWLLTAFFLVIVSGFTLLTTAERIGLFCTLALAASVVVAPWMTLRPSALAARVAQWPVAAVVTSAVVAATFLIGSTVVYQLTPSRFL